MTLHFSNIIHLIKIFKLYHLLEDGKWENMKKSLWYLTAIIHETSAKQPEIRGEEVIPKEEVSCQLCVTNILLNMKLKQRSPWHAYYIKYGYDFLFLYLAHSSFQYLILVRYLFILTIAKKTFLLVILKCQCIS